VNKFAPRHIEDMCIKEDQTTTYDTSSELNNDVDETSVLDGYTSNESAKDEDATSLNDYEEMFQSTDVENPTSSIVYDAYDEGSPSVIESTLDEDSTPNISCDSDDEEEYMLVSRQVLEDQLLVKEEHIVQVLTREDGTHNFIEKNMWKDQIEERQKGVVHGITSAQLHIVKEALKKMKFDYLQLFMDRDLALKFVEDKEREIEEIC
jgi:hypothetical protein